MSKAFLASISYFCWYTNYLIRSLTMAEEEEEIALTINPLNNIGLVYVEQHDYKKSLAKGIELKCKYLLLSLAS